MTAVTYVRVCVLVLAVRPLPRRVGGVSIVLEGYPPPAGIRVWSSLPLRVASCSFRRAHRAHASCESRRCSCCSLRDASRHQATTRHTHRLVRGRLVPPSCSLRTSRLALPSSVRVRRITPAPGTRHVPHRVESFRIAWLEALQCVSCRQHRARHAVERAALPQERYHACIPSIRPSGMPSFVTLVVALTGVGGLFTNSPSLKSPGL